MKILNAGVNFGKHLRRRKLHQVPEHGERKQCVSKKSYYTYEDRNGLSNSDEDENSNDYRLLIAYDDDNFWDALEEDELHEEISKLKICLEENNMIIYTLTYQLAEK